ncbi:EpsG family protein [Hallella sp.]|uniref:EpsG family protein n=1 Tax=Hallella sp. TaxID=2980186 RepID=UPI00307D18DC
MIPVIAFLVFYVFALYVITKKETTQKAILIATLIILTCLIGSRDGWPDEKVYQIAFSEAPRPWDFISKNVESYGYVEKGYLFLASLVKLVLNNSRFYLFCMGGLSMYLLYKGLTAYCAIPLVGLCDYAGRFLLNRDFQQMRSSLAILLLILAIKLIHDRKLVAYMLVVLLAYQFHHLSLIGIPLYFLYKVRIGPISIIFSLVMAMLFSQLLAGSISGVVDDYSQDLNYDTYVQDEYVEQALGLRNPMIYFQIAILMVYTFMEPILASKDKFYHLMRWAYFYSTLILIFFCNYTALSGRTSTVFATCEMFMLPSIAMGLGKEKRFVFYVVVGVILVYFFWSKYHSVMMMIGEV